MCGRYGVHKIEKVIEGEVQLAFEFKPIYNAAPTMTLPVIADEKPHLLQGFQWGLVPSWSKDGKTSYSTINAKSEEIFDKPLYKTPIRKQRCLVIANHFYEWKKITEKEKHPYMIAPQNQAEVFAFAGIWDKWTDKTTGEEKNTFSVITCDPEQSIAHIHSRMPVILNKDSWSTWLDSHLKDNDIKDLMKTYPRKMKAMRVNQMVGNVRNNDACVMDPWEDTSTGSLF